LCAAGAEAVSTKHRPARLRFEGHAVSFAALIANNLEFFALGASASLAGTAKVLAAGIAAGLATLRMAEATLAIIVLFSLTKRKSSSAFGTRYFKVWHRYLPSKIVWFLKRGQSLLQVRAPVQHGLFARKRSADILSAGGRSALRSC